MPAYDAHEKKIHLCAPRGSSDSETRHVSLFKHQPRITGRQTGPLSLLPLAGAVLLPVVELRALQRTGAPAREAWARSGRKTWRAVGSAPGFPGGPRRPPCLLFPPHCPPAPQGRAEDHGAPAGCCSHRREACLSTVEELPPQGAWQRLRADAHAGEPGRGRPRSPRTNIAHLFLLTAETSKLMNYK